MIEEPPPITDRESATNSWNEAMKAAGADDPPVPTPSEQPEKVVATANGTKPVETKTDEFPDEIIDIAKPAEIVPAEDPDAIFNETPKGQVKHEHFTKVQQTAKERVAAARAESDTLKAEIAKLKTSGTGELPAEHVKQVEELRAEREALLERLGQSDYARTDEFAAKFTNKEGAIAKSLAETAEAAGADKETITALLHVPLKKRMAMLDEAELNPSARGRVDALLVRYDEIQQDKAAELANWKTEAAHRQQTQQAQQQARAAAEEKQYNDAFTEVTKELFETEPFRIIPGNEKWNETANRNRANASEIIKGNLSPAAVVRAGVHAAGYETLLGMFRQVQARARDLAAENTKLKGNSPVPASTSQAQTTNRPMTDAEHSRQAWEEAHKANSR